MGIHRGAAIDIGSNTTLYLLGDVEVNGSISITEEETISNDIGGDVFRHGFVTKDVIEQNLRIIKSLIAKAESDGAEKILIAGTSALRQAANKFEFIGKIRDEFNLELMVVDGAEEARLSYEGYRTSENPIKDDLTLFDIGGGSTEIIRVQKGVVQESKSVDIGAVRLHRLFILKDPPDENTFKRMKQYVENTILKQDIILENRRDHSIFSGGTATCLAALRLGTGGYSSDAVEGVELDRSWIEKTLTEFRKIDLKTRKKILHFDPDRADIIIGGTMLILKIMQSIGAKNCIVTHRGLRFGLLASAFK